MTTANMTVPVTKYLTFTDMLTATALDHAAVGNNETAKDYSLAVGAILTLLVDLGALDAETMKPVDTAATA